MDPSFQFWKKLGPEESNEISGLSGEPGGIRTHDPLLKRQMLYRLSYGLAKRNILSSHRFFDQAAR